MKKTLIFLSALSAVIMLEGCYKKIVKNDLSIHMTKGKTL